MSVPSIVLNTNATVDNCNNQNTIVTPSVSTTVPAAEISATTLQQPTAAPRCTQSAMELTTGLLVAQPTATTSVAAAINKLPKTITASVTTSNILPMHMLHDSSVSGSTSNTKNTAATNISQTSIAPTSPTTTNAVADSAYSNQFAANKSNIAKLQWWNAPVQPLRLHETCITTVQQHSEKLPKRQRTATATSIAPTTPPVQTEQQHINNCAPTHTHQQHTHSHAHSHHHHPHSAHLSHHQCSRLNSINSSLSGGIATGSRHGATGHRPPTNTSRMPSFNDSCCQSYDYSQVNDGEEHTSQVSQLLVKEPKPCVGLLNPNEEDEMQVTGYRRSRLRTFLCWLCICLTAGLLRLILHWWRHWYLIATHQKCPLEEAEKVLVQEDYQGKHKIFYVKRIQNLSVSNIRENLDAEEHAQADHIKNNINHHHVQKLQPDDIDNKNLHFSVHFSSAQFKYSKNVRIFNCKQLRYAWDNQTQSFIKIKGLDENVPSAYFHQQKGLSSQEQLSRRLVYGPNEITVPYKDIKTLLFLEMLNPFYVFQIFSVILWFTYNYYYYACVIVLMSVFGISMSIMQTKKNQDSLRETVQNTGYALVVTEHGEVRELPTQCLVPGDIIEIPTCGCTMQCDAVLLSGNCILDESMLTGESVPVTKTPLPMKRDVIFDKKEHARHTLFCGTKVIQTRYIGSEKVLAIVINTGNITAKGGLIRSILYPPPVDYKFEQDSYKFIECLALIALIGFVYTLVTKILRGVEPVKIVVESLDLITIVVPPALPAAMSVGRFYAQKRLEKNSIYCISPRSINVAGSIDCCCFDKTGTLTEDGLDMWGVVPKSVTNQFQMPIKQIERLPCDNFLFGMVTCHSITVMNGKLMGDPLDLKMFESTGWILEDPKDIPDSQKYGLIHPTIVRQPKNPPIPGDEPKVVQRQSSFDDLLADVGLLNGEANNDHGIVREFPFTSNLQRMSVITRRLSGRNFNVYCKGSPEMLQQLCQPSSLPDNYSQQLAVFAKQGYRVIAMAYKPLSRKMNYIKAQRLSRESVESDLEFLGFVVLENRLKPDTTQVIRSLTAANVRTIMVTGDNILTALSVARDCGIVTAKQAVVTVNVRQRSSVTDDCHQPHNYELYYTLELASRASPIANGNGSSVTSTVLKGSIDYGAGDFRTLNGDISSLSSVTVTIPNSSSLASMQTCDTWTHQDLELGLTAVNSPDEEKQQSQLEQEIDNWRRDYRFAMVGKTWQIVREHFPDELRNFVTRGAIFARMSPEQKQALIMELQNLDYCVAMCGDGANDCGALKVAHTGISLSETESSIASPFTSRKPTIACVPTVIKEGRAALVTSFGIFKYMAAYSMVQFISVMILYSIDSNLTDKQYLYIDLGLISVFAFFFGKTEAYAGPLVKQVPLSSLISLTPLASIILHLLVVIGFQVAGWFQLHHQPWFVPFKHSDEDHLGCFENYTMFAISSFQYIILAFVFSKGAPYRKPIWSNIPFCLTLIINLGIVIYLVVYPAEWMADFFQLVVPDDKKFRYWMLCYGAANFLAHVFVESFIVEYLLFKKVQVRRDQDMRKSKRKYMHVEYDLQYFQNWPKISEICEAFELPTYEEPKPTYVEISAEQNLDMPTPQNNALSSFFEVEIPVAPHIMPAIAEVQTTPTTTPTSTPTPSLLEHSEELGPLTNAEPSSTKRSP